MICEIKTANNKIGDYQGCTAEATRVSWSGRLACEEHASIRDMMLWNTGEAKHIAHAFMLYREDVKCENHSTGLRFTFPDGGLWEFYHSPSERPPSHASS